MRQAIALRAQGLFAETFDRKLVLSGGAGAAMVSGTVYYTAIPLLAGDVVANIHIAITQAGVSVTMAKVGLCSPLAVLLGSSANQTSAWESTGMKSIVLASPYTVTSSGLYYIEAIAVAGGTLPGITRGIVASATNAINAAVGGGQMPFGTQTGQADLPANGVLAAPGAAQFPFWAGVSG